MTKLLYPLVTTDIALLTVTEDRLRVLLVQRANEPQRGCWALPGGVLDPARDADLEETARRTLKNKICVDIPYIEQVHTFSGGARDPRGWSLSVLYYALLPADKVNALAGEQAEAIEWADASDVVHRLAFDHDHLLAWALKQLRSKVERAALPLHLLPKQFTLTQLQRTCEAVLGHRLDKSVFRRRIKEEAGLVELEGEFQRGSQRPAQLYRAAQEFKF